MSEPIARLERRRAAPSTTPLPDALTLPGCDEHEEDVERPLRGCRRGGASLHGPGRSLRRDDRDPDTGERDLDTLRLIKGDRACTTATSSSGCRAGRKAGTVAVGDFVEPLERRDDPILGGRRPSSPAARTASAPPSRAASAKQHRPWRRARPRFHPRRTPPPPDERRSPSTCGTTSRSRTPSARTGATAVDRHPRCRRGVVPAWTASAASTAPSGTSSSASTRGVMRSVQEAYRAWPAAGHRRDASQNAWRGTSTSPGTPRASTRARPGALRGARARTARNPRQRHRPRLRRD